MHREDYVDAVRAASADPGAADPAYGLGTVDDPAFAGMHEVSALIAGQSVGAAEAVWRGEALHAVNFAGGLHHAMPGGASGFCIYNDAVAGHRPAAGAGRRAGRVRGCGRAPRGRGAGGVLGGPAGADDLAARASADAVPADRVARGDRGGARGGQRPSMSRCRPGPGTRGGCGPSTPWCRS